MDHQEAVRMDAVERYLLGQLSGPEGDEFESHFFDCSQCAQELREGALFVENSRAVFREDALERPARSAARTVRPPWWRLLWTTPWAPVPALAALVLLAVTGYQNMVLIPGLRTQLHSALTPQAMVSYVLPPLARGDAQEHKISDNGFFYSVYMDPTWEAAYKAYVCTVVDKSGSERFSVTAPAPPPGKPVQILIPHSTLPSGIYTVVIRNAAETGKPEAELARYALPLSE